MFLDNVFYHLTQNIIDITDKIDHSRVKTLANNLARFARNYRRAKLRADHVHAGARKEHQAREVLVPRRVHPAEIPTQPATRRRA